MRLSQPQLFRQEAFIGGVWSASESGKWVAVKNPATSDILGRVPALAQSEIGNTIDAAHRALVEYRSWTAKERCELLCRLATLMLTHKQDLAHILTYEQGKPLSEAAKEIEYAASFFQWFGEEAKRIYGDIIPGSRPDQRITVIRQPVGVCAAITPWNFPSAMFTRKVGPALAAGCTIVVKPALQTPFSALAICALAEQAGVPKGALSVVTGEAAMIGATLTQSELVRKLSFTGSTEVGKKLMAACAGTVKKLSLELGGNSPFIIFNDADLDAAVKGAVDSKFRNAGQTCVCANRFFVQRGIHEAFLSSLRLATENMRLGCGTEEGVTMGPLIDTRAVDKVSRLVSGAVSAGAKIVSGGKKHPAGDLFFEPTILTDVHSSMEITQEEIFGPVIAVTTFDDEKDAIELANATRYGLAAYVYTSDLNRSIRVSEALEFGMVGINEGIISNEVSPFGGIKESGFGKEGSRYGIDEYSERKYVCIGNVK